MKVYDYGKISKCIICGELNGNLKKFIKSVLPCLKDTSNYIFEEHPKKIEREMRMLTDINPIGQLRPRRIFSKKMPRTYCSYGLNDTVLIVNGANLFGVKGIEYYEKSLKMFNDTLAANNCYVLMTRANDDPKYFKEEIVNFSNIKTIDDYSVIKTKNYNCLCIGGSLSIDRSWKKIQGERLGKKMYWEDEKAVLNEGELEKIISEYPIACVITNTCPSFTYPSMSIFNDSSWSNTDKTIVKEIADERNLMDKIYNKLNEKNKKPYVWIYSHFGSSNTSMVNDILFDSLCEMQYFNFNDTVSTFFKVDINKKLQENNSSNTKLKQSTNSSQWFKYNLDETFADYPFVSLTEDNTLAAAIREEISNSSENDSLISRVNDSLIGGVIGNDFTINSTELDGEAENLTVEENGEDGLNTLAEGQLNPGRYTVFSDRTIMPFDVSIDYRTNTLTTTASDIANAANAINNAINNYGTYEITRE